MLGTRPWARYKRLESTLLYWTDSTGRRNIFNHGGVTGRLTGQMQKSTGRSTMPTDLRLQEAALHLEDHAVGLATKQIASSSRGHLSAPRSWWTNHLDCDLWPGPQTPFCTLTMPVHSHNRCIHHHVFHVRLIADCIKQLLKNISFDPVAKPLQDGAPLTKLGWQISPRATCSCNPKHCFQEESIVGATASSVSNCLIPGFDGAIFSHEWKEALWPKFCTGAPPRKRRSVERCNIVKRA